MVGLRVGHESLLRKGLRLPGLARRAAALEELPPLGLLTLAGLADEHWDVELVRDDGRCAIEQTVDAILTTQLDLVAFSALTASVDRAAAISGHLRRRGVVTVLGGLHATAAPETCRDQFDVLVLGDGEPLFPILLDDFRNGTLHTNYRSRQVYDLTRSPVPRWDLLGEFTPPRHTLQTVRGCPWACSFCAASRLLGPPRSKSNQQIQSELDAIAARQKRPWIELADDNTFAATADHDFLLQCLKDHEARWFSESDWRIAHNPSLLRRIAASGCRQLLIGVESNVFRYPGMGGKNAAFESVLDALAAISEHGIVVNACFIVGAEGETAASIERLGDFLEEAPLGEIQLTLQTPFPGTALHRSLARDGRLLGHGFDKYTLFDVVYQPDRMRPEELQGCFDQLIERVFRDELQIRRNHIQREIRKKGKVAG